MLANDHQVGVPLRLLYVRSRVPSSPSAFQKEPLNDPDETHGVCPEHKRRFMAPTADQSYAGLANARDPR